MWLVATLVAALLQVTRTAMQQRLKGLLSPNAAGFVRYGFGAPLSIAAVAVMAAAGLDLPPLSGGFLWRVTLAGMGQIVGTNLLIRSFALRDFAVGTAYSKTEAIQVAILSWVLLSEPLGPLSWIGAGLCLGGVVVLACRGDVSLIGAVLRAGGDRAVWAGFGAGAGFAVAATFIRASSQTLGDHQPLVRALVTLAVMNSIQTVVNGAWLGLRQPAEIAAIGRHWRSSTVVGVTSVVGSAGWAIAMTLNNAAVVRTVGQIDIVFAFVIGRVVFGEERRPGEYWGALLVVAGVALVLLT